MTPFGVEARCERASISSGKTSLWASIRVDPRGKGLETERAPLAVVLVIDVSGSMQGPPIAHVLASCEIVSGLLGPADRLAVVTFSNHAGVRIGLTTCDDDGRQLVRAALQGVVADGGTNMHGGIEAGAGLLASAPAGLRRTLVVLSDGQPNVGISSAEQLAAYVATLRPIGVSTLGFGVHHDENVLKAVATAGSGRYAYIPDPALARVDLARAALAHGGIIADSLELELRPAEGVELVQVVPTTSLRHGRNGVVGAIGDVFVDEGRVIAIELAIDLAPSAKGHLAEVVVRGRSPDGACHEVTSTLVVDLHAGPHAIDRTAQRDILLVRGDATRAEARAHADRGAQPAAVSLLRAMVAQIDASEGFVRDDGSTLAELREQLLDEALNYERHASTQEKMHQRKAAMAYSVGTLSARASTSAPGALVGLSHSAQNRRFALYTDTLIGRSQDNDVPIFEDSISRRHARIMFDRGEFSLHDMGSTNGCEVNGQRVATGKLADGDIVKIGYVEFRFEAK